MDERKELYNKIIFLIILLSSISKFYLINNHEMHRLYRKLSNYTDCAFIGQGGSVVHLLDSLSKLKNFKIIPSQNEQGASLAADAYARCTGKVGLVVATSGPGIINAFQGLACSYYDSIPGIYISGAPVRSMLRKSNKLRSLGFQEMDVVNIVKSFTKYSVRITDINKVDYEIEKCLKIALEGRQGPCLIDLPDDIKIKLETKNKKFFYKKIRVNKKYDVAKFKLLERSKKPLIIVGQGVVQSKTEKKISELIKNFKYLSPVHGELVVCSPNLVNIMLVLLEYMPLSMVI